MTPVHDPPLCPFCGRGSATVPGQHVIRRVVSGRVFERVASAQVCPACGEGRVSSTELERFEREVGLKLLDANVRDAASLPWILDALDIEPEDVGATWAQMRHWERSALDVPEAVWGALDRKLEASQPRANDKPTCAVVVYVGSSGMLAHRAIQQPNRVDRLSFWAPIQAAKPEPQITGSIWYAALSILGKYAVQTSPFASDWDVCSYRRRCYDYGTETSEEEQRSETGLVSLVFETK